MLVKLNLHKIVFTKCMQFFRRKSWLKSNDSQRRWHKHKESASPPIKLTRFPLTLARVFTVQKGSCFKSRER